MAQKPQETTRRSKSPLANLDGDPLGVAIQVRQRRCSAPSRFLWLRGHWIAFSSVITMGFYAWRAPCGLVVSCGFGAIGSPSP